MNRRTALIVIDIQQDYFEGGSNVLVGSLEASLNAQALLKYFREKSLPVIHVQHHSIRPGSTYFIPGSKGAEIHENVRPMDGEKVVIKNYPNSFRDTNLLEYLRLNNITELVICGMMTHMCIDSTTRAAKDLGFACTVIGDASATKNLEIEGQIVPAAEVHRSFLAGLNSFYSTVKSTHAYINQRRTTIRHPLAVSIFL